MMLSLAFMLAATTSAQEPTGDIPTRVNAFGQKLWQAMRLPEGNQAVSPLSVSTCLSMLIDGANEPTQGHLLKTLGFDGLSAKEIEEGNADLASNLTHTEEFTMANGIWLKGSLSPESGYLDSVKNVYGGEVHRFEAPNPAVVREINDWVKAHTKERIPKLIDQLSSTTKAVLVNALTFDGKWKTPFEKSRTKNDDFNPTPSTIVSVPTMHLHGDYVVHGGPGFESLTLTYAGDRFGMVFLLPNPGTNPRELLAKTIPNPDIHGKGRLVTDIAIPKFKIECKYNLKDSLGSLGLSPLYRDAKFGKIAPDLNAQTKLDQIVHRTYIEVDEEGTKAAAATGTVMRGAAIRRPALFKLDRPFAFAILDLRTNTVIMMGTVQNPAG